MANPFAGTETMPGMMGQPQPYVGPTAQPGTFFGMFDNILGVPSRDQQHYMEGERTRLIGQDERFTSGTDVAEVMRHVAAEAAKPGATPDVVFKSAIAHPAFVRAVQRLDPANITKLVQDTAAAAQQPSATLLPVPAGSDVWAVDPAKPGQPRTGTRVISGPGKLGQQIRELGELAGMGPEEIATMARAALMNQLSPEAKTQQERAMGRLIARGLPQETADKLMAGVLKIVQPKNDLGEPIGSPMLHDLTTDTYTPLSLKGPSDSQVPAVVQPNARTPVPAPGIVQPRAPAAPAAPAQQFDPADPLAQEAQPFTPPPVQPKGPVRPGETITGPQTVTERAPTNPTDIFALTGPWSLGKGLLETAGGMFDASLTSGRVREARHAMAVLRTQIQQISLGARRLAIDTKVLDDIIPGLGLIDNPKESLMLGIRLRTTIERMRDDAMDLRKDPQQPRRVKVEAAQQIVSFNGVLKTLPTEEQLQKRLADVDAGAGDIITPGALARDAVDKVKDIYEGGNIRNISRMKAPELQTFIFDTKTPKTPQQLEAARRRLEALEREQRGEK